MGSLYLVRHGQASFGADNYDKLSELGHRQCVRLGEYFRHKGVRFDAALSAAALCCAALACAAVRADGPALPNNDGADGILRVCADPNNMPLSNSKGEGYENRIASQMQAGGRVASASARPADQPVRGGWRVPSTGQVASSASPRGPWG